MYDFLLKIKEETEETVVLERYRYWKYYDNELDCTITLEKTPEVKKALKHWFFGQGKQTHQGVAITYKKDIPTYHKNWRDMYTLHLENGIYLSAPDMYEFLIEKPGVRVQWKMQLGHNIGEF